MQLEEVIKFFFIMNEFFHNDYFFAFFNRRKRVSYVNEFKLGACAAKQCLIKNEITVFFHIHYN